MIRRVVSMTAALALGVGVLAGCAGTTTELSGDASAAMQTAVVSVAEAAAADDQTGAIARLDELQQQLDAALADGSVSTERAARIQAAIDAVRTDLQPVSEPTVEPTPEVTTDPPVTDNGDDGDNSGPGNNNGNGKGNGGGKGKDGG